MMTAAIRMDVWIDMAEQDPNVERWEEAQQAQQGTQYTQTSAEEWRNKKRPAASYTELTQAAQAAKRTKQTKLNSNQKQTLDNTRPGDPRTGSTNENRPPPRSRASRQAGPPAGNRALTAPLLNKCTHCDSCSSSNIDRY